MTPLTQEFKGSLFTLYKDYSTPPYHNHLEAQWRCEAGTC